MQFIIYTILASAFILQTTIIHALHSPIGIVKHGLTCGGSVLDVLQLAFYHPPSSPSGKCMLACLLKDVGVINVKGEYSKDGTLNYLKKYWSGLAYTDKELMAIMEKCCEFSVPKTYTQCDFAYEIGVCLTSKLEPIRILSDAAYTTKEAGKEVLKIPQPIQDSLKDITEKISMAEEKIAQIPVKIEESVDMIKKEVELKIAESTKIVKDRVTLAEKELYDQATLAKLKIEETVAGAQKQIYDQATLAKLKVEESLVGAQKQVGQAYDLTKVQAESAVDKVKEYLFGPIFPKTPTIGILPKPPQPLIPIQKPY